MRVTREQLELEFDRFVEFGMVLDRLTRKYLVQYLKHYFTPDDTDWEELDANYFQYFRPVFDDLFADEALLHIGREHELLGYQVIADTLQWFRKTYQRIAQQHPFEDEVQELENWGVRTLQHFVKSWMFLPQRLSTYYTEEEVATAFHRDRLKALIQGRESVDLSLADRRQVELVWDDLLRQWDARLQAKILQFQLRKLVAQKEDYKEKLQAKTQEFKRLSTLISPFTEYLTRYWDMSRQLWESTTFEAVQQYHEYLQNEPSLQRLADLLGRLRQAEVETEEEAYESVLVYQAWVDDPMQRSEIVGITTGNELNSLVSSEVALLSDAETEAAFLKKYADHDLLVKQYRDQRLERRAEIHSESEQRVKLKEKGPFIICVDTSGSMEGEPERIAKAMCFAILKMASRENRSAFLINFSSGVQTIDLTDLSQSIDAIARFLQLSFHGGTDISLALHEALKQLQEHQYRDADVLVVSDFIMYKVEPDILQGMAYQQHHHGTQFHNLIISDQANLKVIEQFDHNWIYDPQEKGVIKQLYQELRQLMARPI